MAFVPRFLQDRDRYEVEKTQVRTVKECSVLRDKWLNEDQWPRKSREQLKYEAEELRKRLRSLGWRESRKWTAAPGSEDVPPDAHYERDVVGFEIAWPLRFGRDAWQPPVSPKGMWTRRCAACGIDTFSRKVADQCPLCGRRLIWIWAASDED